MARQILSFFSHDLPEPGADARVVHIVIVDPILVPRVVRRIDVDAIHLPGIEVFQKLQGMVVVRLDQRAPQVTVRRIADLVDGLEIRVNWLPELRHADKFLDLKLCRGALVFIQACGNAILDL